MDEHDDLVVALTPLIDVLDRLGVTWYVGGSVASTVHGRFRATNDIDVIAALREERAVAIRAALEADHYVDEVRSPRQRRPGRVKMLHPSRPPGEERPCSRAPMSR